MSGKKQNLPNSFSNASIFHGGFAIYRMITANPAAALKIKAGQIVPGFFGDFFILRNPFPGLSPLEALFHCEDRDTLAVIVAGVPVFGPPGIFTSFRIKPQILPSSMGSLAAQRGVNFPRQVGLEVARDYQHLSNLFASQGVKNLSLPLVADDLGYRNAIENVKGYTFDLAKQIARLSADQRTMNRAQLLTHVRDASARRDDLPHWSSLRTGPDTTKQDIPVPMRQ